MPDLAAELSEAVRLYWRTRQAQNTRQGAGGNRDQGDRAAVTGGAQMDGFVRIVRERLVEVGILEHTIFTARRTIDLPGYFRPTKDWDLVVVHQRHLLAAMEFKSQAGPSFGNNFNNRTEEALGNATDIWTAYREGAFHGSARPWLGFFMLLEKTEGSIRSVRTANSHFPVFPEFRNASYARRYELLCQRLVRERLYSASCLLLSDRERGPDGWFEEPSKELSFKNLLASLVGKAVEHAEREG